MNPQKKVSPQRGSSRQTLQPKKAPVAPPVYRPQPVTKVAQAKFASPGHLSGSSPTAPAVYRPEPTLKVLQRKVVQTPVANQGNGSKIKAKPPSFAVAQTKSAGNKLNPQRPGKNTPRAITNRETQAIQRTASTSPRRPSSTIQAASLLKSAVTAISGISVNVRKDVVPRRDPKKLGIGEEIGLSIDNPGFHRTVTWAILSGGGTLIAGAVNGSATYRAPSTAGNVVLRLRDDGGTVHQTLAYEIVAPIPQLILDVKEAAAHEWGRTNGGFKGTVRMLPNDVSFSNLQVTEGVDAVRPSDSGVFSGMVVPHPAARNWHPAMDITADGTIFNCVDTVALRPGNPLDGMVLSSAKKDEVMGTILRSIQWHYRVNGDPTVYDWCIAVSTYTAYGDGRLERTKGGVKAVISIFGKAEFSRIRGYVVEGDKEAKARDGGS